MSFITLGFSGAVGHDPAAALFRDGELVAAVEEERLARRKHAKGMLPYEAARFCMNFAGIRPREVDTVAIPYAPVSLFSPARWHYARRYWYAPDRSLDALFNGNRRYRRYVREIKDLLDRLEIPWSKVRFQPVPHLLAHASGAYHLSGFEEKTALLVIDMRGEYATTFLGYGEHGRIHKIKEFYAPDSLSGMYAAITDYLGFDMLDGEYKVMGMAPYGDPDKYDMSRLVDFSGRNFKVNTRLINTVGLRRYKDNARGYYFSPALVDYLGPRRVGELQEDPYFHYAAGIQKLYEDIVLGLCATYLSDVLEETGKLAFAGAGALNVKLNQRLLSLPWVDELFVQPAASHAGTAIGAAAFAVARAGTRVGKLKNMYLGPGYTSEQCVEACEAHRDRPRWEVIEDAPARAAALVAEGHPLAWFQGRMEFGPRALGNRSILANPGTPGIVERINRQIKFRELWRPFCPSIIDSQAEDFLGTVHPAEFMTMTFDIPEKWRLLFPSVVYRDGTSRVHVVTRQANPRFHELLQHVESLTGYGVVINTSLNRPGEPMICSPENALELFFGSDLEYMIMEDVLVTKSPEH